MSDTITGSGGTHTPTLFLAYETLRDGGAVVDELLSGDIAVQLGPASSRRGRHSVLFSDITDAVSLESELKTAQVLTLASTTRPALNMDFVVPRGGQIVVAIDPRTRRNWIVTWDFREVPA